MSGTGIMNILLSDDIDLVSVVPAARIISGILPLKTAVPAIGITSISGQPLGMIVGKETLWTDRVQVTVHAPTYAEQKRILQLVRDALPEVTRGIVGSHECDSISVDIEGPDIYDHDENIHIGSQDFIVRYVR